jgi:3-phenylpropionate/trans-cinnamate dioxygenase ferredoxin subunit
MPETWIDAGDAGALPLADVVRFDHGDRTFALYCTADGRIFATDGLCTHAKVHLAGGFVMDDEIECPKHNGRFNFTTGQALGAPVCINLKTYPVKVEEGRIYLRVE